MPQQKQWKPRFRQLHKGLWRPSRLVFDIGEVFRLSRTRGWGGSSRTAEMIAGQTDAFISNMVQIRKVVYARGESGEFIKQLVIIKDEAEASEMLTAEDVARLLAELEE